MDKNIIEKLNNNNYFVWKFKIRLLLIKEDVWDAVSLNVPIATRN